MTDTVQKLMELADDYADWAEAKGKGHCAREGARQALEDELTRLFTPLTDEQIEKGVKAWFENDIVSGQHPFSRRMRAAINAAHGITGESK